MFCFSYAFHFVAIYTSLRRVDTILVYKSGSKSGSKSGKLSWISLCIFKNVIIKNAWSTHLQSIDRFIREIESVLYSNVIDTNHTAATRICTFSLLAHFTMQLWSNRRNRMKLKLIDYSQRFCSNKWHLTDNNWIEYSNAKLSPFQDFAILMELSGRQQVPCVPRRHSHYSRSYRIAWSAWNGK